MRDDELRALARGAEAGDPDQAAGLLVRQVRAGQLPRGVVKLWAWLGEPGALAAWEGLGELERPPSYREVEGELRARRGAERRLPPKYVWNRYAKVWALGIAGLGEEPGIRVALAALRCAEALVPPNERHPRWAAIRALAEEWLRGEHEQGERSDALALELTGLTEAGGTNVLRAVLSALSCLSALGAAESGGEAVLALARLGGELGPDAALWARLRAELPAGS